MFLNSVTDSLLSAFVASSDFMSDSSFSPFWCLIVSCRMSVLKISFSFRIMSGLILPALILWLRFEGEVSSIMESWR